MSGASSHDIRDGILEPDDPAFEEKLRRLDVARKTLDRIGREVDHIVSHCCPSSIQEMFTGDLYQRDVLTDFFDGVRTHCRFQYWFSGHYHENMVKKKKSVMLYERINRLKCGKQRK